MVRIALVFIALIGGPLVGSWTFADPWDVACELYDVYEVAHDRKAGACKSVPRPDVTYYYMQEGLWGYYVGGNTIYVSRDLPIRRAFSTTLHEMVHYIDVVWHGLEVPGPTGPVCVSEDKAWEIEGYYTGEDNSQWWVSYPHCWDSLVEEGE